MDITDYTIAGGLRDVLNSNFNIPGSSVWNYQSGSDKPSTHYWVILNEHVPYEYMKVTIFQYGAYNSDDNTLDMKQYSYTPDYTYMWTIPFSALCGYNLNREYKISRLLSTIVDELFDNPDQPNNGYTYDIKHEKTPFPSKLKLSDFYTYWSFRKCNNWYTVLCPADAPFSVKPIWVSQSVRRHELYDNGAKQYNKYTVYGNRIPYSRYNSCSRRYNDMAFKLPEGYNSRVVGSIDWYKVYCMDQHKFHIDYLPECEQPKTTAPTVTPTISTTTEATVLPAVEQNVVKRCISNPMPDDKPEPVVSSKTTVAKKKKKLPPKVSKTKPRLSIIPPKRTVDPDMSSDTFDSYDNSCIPSDGDTTPTVQTTSNNTSPTVTTVQTTEPIHQPTLMGIVEDLKQYIINEVTRLINA